MRDRHANARRGAVHGGVERLQSRLVGEHERDRPDRVVQADGDRAAGNQGQKGKRQGQQKGQQRSRSDLSRERPNRDTKRSEAERAESEREHPQPDPR